MRFLFFISFLALPMFSISQANVILNVRCNEAYQDILALKFDKAKILLAQEKLENPENLYIPYLENYIDFLSVFISEDYSLFTQVEANKSERIDLIKKLDDKSPYRNFMLGNINLQWAVVRLKFQEYFTAAFEINRAYRLLVSNKENFPGFIQNNISLGVLHIMIGLVPDNYRWLLDIINMDGNVEEGKKELQLVLKKSLQNESYNYLRNETLFYLGFVELNVHPDKKQLNFLLSQLNEVQKDNLLLKYLTINILMRTGNNEQVLEKFDELPDLNSYFPFYYLRYLEGEAHLRKLETEEASENFHLFIKAFDGQNFIKDAQRKIAWTHLLNKDTIGYKEAIYEVPDLGYTNVGQDKDAEREAESGNVPNAELIKARLLFDGGYYTRADSVLNTIDTSVFKVDNAIELVYRKGRIADKLNNTENAKIYYQNAIDLGKNSSRYFAGNSALKLGEIYESENNFKQAAYFYQTCLDLDFNEYETGIHSKARAALKRISARD
jgi:hypothetical protein